MRPLLYRLLKLVHPRWGWFIFGLALILALPVAVMAMAGSATSTYTLCQSCHGIGEVAYVPEERRIVTEAEQGILPLKEERDRHKALLTDWMKSVVHEGDRIYVAGDGQEYNMSLTGTCMDCHSIKAEANQADFCARCHSYAAVRLNCWNCHNLPDLKAINNR